MATSKKESSKAKATPKNTAVAPPIPESVSTESSAPEEEITQGVEDPTPHPAEVVDSPAVLNADTPAEGPYVEADPTSHEYKPSAQGSDLASKIQNS